MMGVMVKEMDFARQSSTVQLCHTLTVCASTAWRGSWANDDLKTTNQTSWRRHRYHATKHGLVISIFISFSLSFWYVCIMLYLVHRGFTIYCYHFSLVQIFHNSLDSCNFDSPIFITQQQFVHVYVSFFSFFFSFIWGSPFFPPIIHFTWMYITVIKGISVTSITTLMVTLYF